MSRKPELHLLRNDAITAETLARLFERLTGESSTPEQIEEVRAELEGGKNDQHAGQPDPNNSIDETPDDDPMLVSRKP